MNQAKTVNNSIPVTETSTKTSYLFLALFAGLLVPFGFAPFHLPGLSILGIALLFGLLQHKTLKQSFYAGFAFGLSMAGLGVTWVYVSINQYGHLAPVIAGFITLVFVMYFAAFLAVMSLIYKHLSVKHSLLFSCLLFAAIWCFIEFFRAKLLGGFPWLMLGFSQMDTPIKYVLPLLGIYGGSFFAVLAATCLASSFINRQKRAFYMIAFVAILLCPNFLKNISWTTTAVSPIPISIIQANISMRDKWDETVFWKLVAYYRDNLAKLLGKSTLIVLPESAFPIPPSYISDLLDSIAEEAKQKGSAVLLGIPQPATEDENQFYNSMTSLGLAHGTYLKQHLVPFGEFIPGPFEQLMKWLSIPLINMKQGETHQPLIQVLKHPIASLICYELAYPELLRKQMPAAEWIVSISDDGWFGHSLAMYQQLQMSQLLSIQTGRYQIVANNDGLSSIINPEGDIVTSLPPFTNGVLEGSIYAMTGATPWIYLGDAPMILILCLIILIAVVQSRQRSIQLHR